MDAQVRSRVRQSTRDLPFEVVALVLQGGALMAGCRASTGRVLLLYAI